jgi:hypothetical protein
MSATNRATVLALDPQQCYELIRELVDSQPSAHEAMLSVLPSIAPTQPAQETELTESIYFADKVEWCETVLSDEYMNHRTTSDLARCQAVSIAVIYEINEIRTQCGYNNTYGGGDPTPQIPADCDDEASYFLDAKMALLDIGLLILERRNRLWRQDWCCSKNCPWTVVLRHTFEDLRDNLGEPSWSEELFWIESLFHEQPDGSSHPMRLTCSKLVDLPALLPPLSSHANVEGNAHDRFADVGDVFVAMRRVSRGNQLPNLTSDPISGIRDLKI